MESAIGVANLETYMLEKLGIDAEMVTSEKHAFVKLKNIKIPYEDGFKTGDTLLDPTWDMGNHRFNARPQYFCVSYEEIRKADILQDGKDRESHKNEELSGITLQLNDEYLRRVYRSIRISR